MIQHLCFLGLSLLPLTLFECLLQAMFEDFDDEPHVIGARYALLISIGSLIIATSLAIVY